MDTSMGHVKSVWDESDAPTGDVTSDVSRKNQSSIVDERFNMPKNMLLT